MKNLAVLQVKGTEHVVHSVLAKNIVLPFNFALSFFVFKTKKTHPLMDKHIDVDDDDEVRKAMFLKFICCDGWRVCGPNNF